ncbi:hypothetical protein ACM0CV_25845, partial [Mycobacteroides abscessus subsp. abscessus]
MAPGGAGRETRVRLVAVLVTAATLVVAELLGDASASADPLRPVSPPLDPGEVVRIGPVAGTGTATAEYNLGATDLCEFMVFTGGMLQVCGDSFAGQGVGYGGWHSPVALRVDTESVAAPPPPRPPPGRGAPPPPRGPP